MDHIYFLKGENNVPSHKHTRSKFTVITWKKQTIYIILVDNYLLLELCSNLMFLPQRLRSINFKSIIHEVNLMSIISITAYLRNIWIYMLYERHATLYSVHLNWIVFRNFKFFLSTNFINIAKSISQKKNG